jgi:uncharacterized protein YndB with AHSA1/START domain
MDDITGDGRTAIELRSDREFVVTRIFDAPPRMVFEAWTKAELFQLWWAPRSIGVPMLACEMDARTGGGYSVTFGKDASEAMTFYGKYLEVTPPSRLVWTNDEGENGAVTTVTFEEEEGGKTRLTLSELYPSKEALEAGRGAEEGLPEQFAQLDNLLASLTANA